MADENDGHPNMQQPIFDDDVLNAGYGTIYAKLSELRESFHRSGRLDDSNAKLDEIAKLFATYLAFKKGLIPQFPSTDANLIEELQAAFAAAATLPQYALAGDHPIFGLQPTLILRAGDEVLANDLVQLVKQCVDMAFDLRQRGHAFDVLNEAFGHFVRDNFRGNIEDAQYMTPPEVVDFMADLVLGDLAREEPEKLKPGNQLTVLDPSCGVGSFLTAIYERSRKSGSVRPNQLRLFGQDKVERMARLATINLELFEVHEHRITIGNSLATGSPLDDLNGAVDVVLTNPPFGARFDGVEIFKKFGANTPFFSSLNRGALGFVDSELLFIDRNLRLLRDGGRLLIVIPDGVISAKGNAALLRQHLRGVATVRAIIELPAVTFAQAGTRTKTAVLYIQKGIDKKRGSKPIFMGLAKDLGFQVAGRKGVQIKQPQGNNELPWILQTYREFECTEVSERPKVLSRDPSCVLVSSEDVLRGSWTPSHYSSRRLDAIAAIGTDGDFEMVPLGSLVEFCADSRRNEKWKADMAYLSVLHVIGEGVIDIGAANTYAPKTPGVPTYPGEVLLARINPRIPRVCITPDFGCKTLCSSEFEVMTTKNGLDPYLLAYLLLTATVQHQIRSLTSGTSASHNRIRTSELATVLVPMAKKGTKSEHEIERLTAQYRKALQAMTAAAAEIAKLRAAETSVK